MGLHRSVYALCPARQSQKKGRLSPSPPSRKIDKPSAPFYTCALRVSSHAEEM
ncbi:hypothetical protein ARMA_2568 [Ardenticatena maritima]|uniref:Uncharacterized protein n=1 Tax=Ardenticatena maritima TaxID=872965 RepID=A0A0M8K8W1_9CHLR|nr:hypothetical protein ARMA_2568 [Ardenticatena maritima]